VWWVRPYEMFFGTVERELVIGETKRNPEKIDLTELKEKARAERLLSEQIFVILQNGNK
jgi:hypothetical protein